MISQILTFYPYLSLFARTTQSCPIYKGLPDQKGNYIPKFSIEILINLWREYLSARFDPNSRCLYFLKGLEGDHDLICLDASSNKSKGGLNFGGECIDYVVNNGDKKSSVMDPQGPWSHLHKSCPAEMKFSTFYQMVVDGAINIDCAPMQLEIGETETSAGEVKVENALFKKFIEHVVKTATDSAIASQQFKETRKLLLGSTNPKVKTAEDDEEEDDDDDDGDDTDADTSARKKKPVETKHKMKTWLANELCAAFQGQSLRSTRQEILVLFSSRCMKGML